MFCFVMVDDKYFDGEYKFTDSGSVEWILHDKPISNWNTKAIAKKAVKAIKKQYPNATIAIVEGLN